MTGIVLEIQGEKSIILKDDGSYTKLTTQPQWRQGDVITIKNRNITSSLSILAASILLLLIIGSGGYTFYYTEASMISIDVNPSIELQLNSFDRVISTVSYNKSGEQLLENIDINNKKYEEAVKIIMEAPEIEALLSDDPYLIFAVQAKGEKKETSLLNTVKETSYNALSHHNHDVNKIEYTIVDKDLVSEAHSYGVSSGKYTLLLELKETAPTIDIDQYCHSSINEIKDEIHNHHQTQDNHHSHH